MTGINKSYARKKGFDLDNHLTNEVRKALPENNKTRQLDSQEAKFFTQIIDEYGVNNIIIKKTELIKLGKEFGLNYSRLSKIGPALERAIRKRANLTKEIKGNLQTFKVVQRTSQNISNVLKLSNLGKNFGEWLALNGPKNTPRGKCGIGVYKNINHFFASFGINKAIKKENGRYGYKWGEILENPSNLDSRIKVTKIPVDYPKDAPIGSIIYYDKKNKKGNKKYGHVEIAGNNGFYSDGKAHNPGGSAWIVKQDKVSPSKYRELTGFSGYAYKLELV